MFDNVSYLSVLYPVTAFALFFFQYYQMNTVIYIITFYVIILIKKFFLFIYLFFFTLKGYWLRGKKIKYKKKIPLVAKPCKEDSRRNKKWGQFNLV